MKIASVTTVNDRCGIADYAGFLNGALQRAGVVVETFSLDKAERSQAGFYKALASRLNTADIDVIHIQHEFSFFGPGSMPASFPQRDLAARFTGGLVAASSFFRFMKALHRPTIVTCHELARPRGVVSEHGVRLAMSINLAAYSVELTFRQGTLVIAHSPARAQELADLGVETQRLRVVPIGIQQPARQIPQAEARRTLNLDPRKKIVVTFGFVNSRKQIEVLLEAAKQLHKEALIAIVGGITPGHEDYAQSLRQRADALGLSNRVIFTGYVGDDERDLWLAASDVQVLTATEMGAGSMSVNSAIARGVPTVAWDIAPMAELERRFGCLRLLPRGNEKELGRAIDRLLSDRGAWDKVHAETRRAAKKHSVDDEARQVIGVYLQAHRLGRATPSDWSWARAGEYIQRGFPGGRAKLKHILRRADGFV